MFVNLHSRLRNVLNNPSLQSFYIGMLTLYVPYLDFTISSCSPAGIVDTTDSATPSASLFSVFLRKMPLCSQDVSLARMIDFHFSPSSSPQTSNAPHYSPPFCFEYLREFISSGFLLPSPILSSLFSASPLPFSLLSVHCLTHLPPSILGSFIDCALNDSQNWMPRSLSPLLPPPPVGAV